MEELEQAILECSNPDYELHYKSLDEKARYILSISRKIIAKENKIDMDSYCDELAASID